MSVGHIPEDRHRDGMILEMTVAENIALQTYYKEPNSKNGILNYNIINAKASELMNEFDVRGAGELIAGGDLSGGNQQKAVIAREIDRNPDLLIVSQPTRGLDVGAIEYIRKRIIAERDNGKAIIVVSFELDEILDMSDQIAVIYDGAIQGVALPKLSAKFKLKRTPTKAPITMIPSSPTFTIPPRSEKVPPILVKISGAEYFSIEATIKDKIVIKSILVLSSFSFH